MMETLIWASVAVLAIVLAFIRTRPISRREIDAINVKLAEFSEVAAAVKPHLAELPPMYQLVRQVAGDVKALKPQKALFENWDELIRQFEDLKRSVETVKLKHLGQRMTGGAGADT